MRWISQSLLAALGHLTHLHAAASASNVTSETFLWPSYPELIYAVPVAKSNTTKTYAPNYQSLSGLYAHQKTTTWASVASPTDSSAKYGNVAWSAQWSIFSNITAPPFTTTMPPTPVASSELIKPTPFPFPEDPSIHEMTFPDGFVYGFAGAALQVEGAVKNEGRGPSLTEALLQKRYAVTPGGGPPDVTNLNYYLYKQDIARLAAVGVQTYSFSISWSRVVPFAVPGTPVNQEAIDHYNDLIDTILEYGMTPMVTLHHFDTPLYFQRSNITSWQSYDHPEFVQSFVNYAKIVLGHFSDRVPYWVTFNEPTLDAPNVKNWASSHNVVMAHSQVVHWYRDVIKGTGKWGLKVAFDAGGFALPLDPNNPEDVAAAERSLDFNVNYISNPLVLGIQPPETVLSTLGNRAPIFTDEELVLAKGTVDFYAFDLYRVSYTTYVEDGLDSCVQNRSHPRYPWCVNSIKNRDGWQVGVQSASIAYMMYQHLRTVLKYFSSRYPTELGILIAEFGFPPFGGIEMTVDNARTDLAQSTWYLSNLGEILKAINLDGVKMHGAIGWSWVDNWEWGQYHDKFGVQGFNSTTLERYYKRTIFDVVDFIRGHSAAG
ncbi:glycoside hydrolase [Byssothecium circinans]|uniref:Glycoside hydrolase n=1 Tax=Byssothecium circinans TaxID=147558 RepID=A0A6A5U4H0_9PLEO|nr:glycoside hydrolase [Byssothecium circinans]